MVSVTDKDIIISKLLKALESDDALTRSEFQSRAGKIYHDVMKSHKGEEKKDVEKQKRKPTRWNHYLQQKIAEMMKEDEEKSKNERRTSRDMFKLASELWKAGDKETFVC